MRSDILLVKVITSITVGSALTLVAIFMSGGSALLAAPGLAIALMFFFRAAYLQRTRGRIRRIEEAVRNFGPEQLELVREVLKRLPYFEDIREIDTLLRDRGVEDRQQRAAIAFAAVEARKRQIIEAQAAAARVVYEGGDGSSPADAVVLKGAVTPTAIDLAIMRWIEGRLGPRDTAWQREGQEQLDQEGKRLAVIAVRSTETDESQRFYFDLSAALRGRSGRAAASEGE